MLIVDMSLLMMIVPGFACVCSERGLEEVSSKLSIYLGFYLQWCGKSPISSELLRPRFAISRSHLLDGLVFLSSLEPRLSKLVNRLLSAVACY